MKRQGVPVRIRQRTREIQRRRNRRPGQIAAAIRPAVADRDAPLSIRRRPQRPHAVRQPRGAVRRRQQPVALDLGADAARAVGRRQDERQVALVPGGHVADPADEAAFRERRPQAVDRQRPRRADRIEPVGVRRAVGNRRHLFGMGRGIRRERRRGVAEDVHAPREARALVAALDERVGAAVERLFRPARRAVRRTRNRAARRLVLDAVRHEGRRGVDRPRLAVVKSVHRPAADEARRVRTAVRQRHDKRIVERPRIEFAENLIVVGAARQPSSGG